MSVFFAASVPLTTGIGNITSTLGTFFLICVFSFMFQYFVIHWSFKNLWKEKNTRIIVLVISFVSAFSFQAIGLSNAIFAVQTITKNNIDDVIINFSKWTTIYTVAYALFVASACVRRNWEKYLWFFS